MQPLIASQPLLLIPLQVSYLIWTVMEVILQIRQRKRFRAGAQRRDKGSHTLIVCLSVLGIFLCALLAFTVPAAAITSAREIFFWLGLVLVYVGIAFRLYAISVLGTFFTTTVAVTAGQSVIEAGPYRLIRHPAYTGILITLLGFGLCYTNWSGLLALMGCILPGFWYRIHVEEQILQEHLGLPYQEYMQRTKRLIPFVL